MDAQGEASSPCLAVMQLLATRLSYTRSGSPPCPAGRRSETRKSLNRAVAKTNVPPIGPFVRIGLYASEGPRGRHAMLPSATPPSYTQSGSLPCPAGRARGDHSAPYCPPSPGYRRSARRRRGSRWISFRSLQIRYNELVTREDAVQHWQQGARDALESAKILCHGKQYASALFHCHLAVEKALKASYIAHHDKDHPHTHDLLQLALLLKSTWTLEEKTLLSELTDYAVAARYGDPSFTDQQATEENAVRWIEATEHFLGPLLPP